MCPIGGSTAPAVACSCTAPSVDSPTRSQPARPCRGRIRSAALLLLLVTLLALVAVPSGAELVVFSSGHVLKTETFEVVGDTARMELPSGGAVQVSLAVIQRVVANEVELTPEERRLPLLDLEMGGGEGAEAASGLADGDLVFETAPPEEDDPAEPDPARSISGTVLNEAGEPVDKVHLTARGIRLFQPEEGPATSEEEAQATTADKGSYRFENLPQGEYMIHAAATDRYAAAQTTVRTGVDFANLRLSEKRRLWVYGSVTDSDGEPLADVQVVPRGQPDKVAATDYLGHYVLEMSVADRGRDHELRFALEGYRKQALGLPASRISGRDEIQLDARLEPIRALAAVAGRVSASDGGPLGGESVVLRGETRYHALTDEAGEFLIPEVVADATYHLLIRPRAAYQDHERRVRVGASGLDLDVVLEPLGYGIVSGQMIDILGDPVPHVSLWLRSADDSAQQLLVTGDASGRYGLDRVPTGPFSFATLANPRLTISGPVLSPRQPEKRVDLVLDWGSHEIRGRVVDTQGNPVAASQVTLYWAHYQRGVQSRAVRHTAVAADGSFRFTQLGPGEHTVTVRAPGFHSRQLEAESPGDLVVQLWSRDQTTAFQGK